MKNRFNLIPIIGLFLFPLIAFTDTPTPPFPNPVGVTQSNPALLNADVLIVNPSPIPVSGTFAISVPYAGPLATPAPSQAAFIGGVDGSGKLQGLKVNGSQALTVDASGTTVPVSGTFYQATQPVSGSVSVSNFPSTQNVAITSSTPIPVTGTFYQATQPVSGSVSVTGSFPTPIPFPTTQNVAIVSSTPIPVTGTFYQSTQNVAIVSSTPIAVTGAFPTPYPTQAISGTVTANQGAPGASPWPVSASSLPLPTLASTSTNQATEITALETINTTLGTPFQAGASIGNTSFGVSGTITPLVYTNGSASNSTVVGSSGVVTFSAPTHAIGFIVEAESGNTVNLRYACGTTATTTVGMLLEPGRDSGYINSACTVTVIAVSSSAQAADIQWVLSQ
jgi:hypothetical protein